MGDNVNEEQSVRCTPSRRACTLEMCGCTCTSCIRIDIRAAPFFPRAKTLAAVPWADALVCLYEQVMTPERPNQMSDDVLASSGRVTVTRRLSRRLFASNDNLIKRDWYGHGTRIAHCCVLLCAQRSARPSQAQRCHRRRCRRRRFRRRHRRRHRLRGCSCRRRRRRRWRLLGLPKRRRRHRRCHAPPQLPPTSHRVPVRYAAAAAAAAPLGGVVWARDDR